LLENTREDEANTEVDVANLVEITAAYQDDASERLVTIFQNAKTFVQAVQISGREEGDLI
jgi:hypothetical protein